MSANKKILFIVNGYGLGNYSRCLPLIRQLSELGHTVDVISSGLAGTFFKQEKKIRKYWEYQRLTYPSKDGKLNLSLRISDYLPLFKSFLSNRRLLAKILKEENYQLVYTDSDYTMLGMRHDHNLQHIGINNSFSVLNFFRHNECPQDLKKQLRIEYCDYYIHRLMADQIICPSIDSHFPSKSKVTVIRPMIRQEIKNIIKKKNEDGRKTIVIMLTSSGLETELPSMDELSQDKYRVIVITSNIEKHKFPKHFEQCAFSADISSLLSQADFLLINAGQGSVAEAIYLNIPSLIFPIEGHAEQWANAHMAGQYKHIKVYHPNCSIADQLRSIQ